MAWNKASKPLKNLIQLFPLNRACGFGCEVIEHTVDAIDLGGDASGDAMKDRIGDFLNGSAHSIGGIDGTDDCGPALVAAVILHADGFHIGNGDKVLPYLAGKSGVIEFLAKDSICLTKRVKALAGDCAKATDTETGTGEGLTVNHRVRKSERLTYYTDLVLVEEFQGLAKLKLKVLGKSADIMVGLDCLLALCLLDGFQNVGIDCTLCKELHALKLACLVGKNIDEFRTDDFSLALGIGNTCEQVEEAIGRIDINKVGIELISEHLNDILGFIFTHQTVVDMNTDQLLTDCLYQKGGNHRGIYATGEREKDHIGAYLLTDSLHLFINKRVCLLGGGDTGKRFRSSLNFHFFLLISVRTRTTGNGYFRGCRE